MPSDDMLHELKSFDQEDETVVLECTCGWGVTLEGWEGEDEKGNKQSRSARKFVESFTNSHMLLNWQWPYEEKQPDNWKPKEA